MGKDTKRLISTVVVLSGLLSTPVAGGVAVPLQSAAQDGGLRIVVIEGEDSVNIIGQGTAVPTVVEVRDRNDLPVSGASVVFLLGEGGTATLNAGLSQVTLTTNVLGQAAVTVNPVASGAVQLSVNATFQGQTAAAAIVQTNAASAAAAGAGGGAAGGGGGGAGGGGAAGGAGGGAGGAGGGAAAGGAAGGGLGTGAIVGVVGAGAGAAAAGAAVAGGDGGTDNGTPQNPPVAALSILPAGAGMAGATLYRFDASGSSDPDRETLTFAWDFGDGSQGTGMTTTHVYAAAGAYSVTLTVSDGRTQTTAMGSVTVARNLGGGRFVGSGEVAGLDAVLDLTQTGAGLGGQFSREMSSTNAERRSWTISGRLTSPDDFVCPCGLEMTFHGATAGTADQDYRGTVDADATLIELNVGEGGGTWVFTRQ